MSRTKSSLRRDQMDPVVLHARREALVILGAFVLFLIWSVSSSYLTGYHDPAGGALPRVLGMPGWVFWGVLVPWLAADLFGLWFCFFFMADDALRDTEDEADAGTGETAQRDIGEEGRHA